MDGQIEIEDLWNQMHSHLCRFICGRIPDGDDAEDIVQEVFLRIHTHLDTIRQIDRLESWMYQVARNSISDYYRARRRQAALTDEDGEELNLGDRKPSYGTPSMVPASLIVAFSPTEEDTAESLAPYIREIVQSLPEAYRQAILLTEYEGLSQKEMADRLGISLSGAKSRVQRARMKIRDIMLACCHFEFDARGLVYDYRPHCCCCD